MPTITPEVLEKATAWLGSSYDNETQKQVRFLLENNPAELIESFYRSLEFGTGGLRGIMGVGTNRMNKYTVGMATQGLANYLRQCFAALPQIQVAIAHDCRNNSVAFAKIVAGIFAANGFKVYLFDALRPTPELSFAIRRLRCQSGVMVTASHNPKEYNGYKAYWDDGAQVTAPYLPTVSWFLKWNWRVLSKDAIIKQ
jgi:phosphoglucomutase